MTIETQEQYQEIVSEDIDILKKTLDTIRDKIAVYHPYTQLEFLKPIKHMIVEAFQDAIDPDDDFLNNYNPKDKIVING